MVQTNTQTVGNRTLMAWTAPIMANHERGTRWYVTAGIVVVTCAAYGIISGAWTLTLVSILSGAMYFLLREHKHPDFPITIGEAGVTIRGQFLSWEETRGYWMLLTPEYAELHFTPKNTKKRDLKIQTGDQNLAIIKETLKPFIPEISDKSESAIDFVIRFCKL